MRTFKELELSTDILKGLETMGYAQPTTIQEEAIPLSLQGIDILGQSKTGSGKTAAFAIPSLMQVKPELNQPQVLIVAPTRELALQITDEMKRISKFMDGVFYATLYGGEPIARQFKDLKKAQVIIGTPGRLLDHIKRKTLNLKHLKVAILDEADEMLSMGFLEDIQEILKKTPVEKQTQLFSATMPKSIINLSKEFLVDPQKITVKDTSVPGSIEQYYYEVIGRQKKQATATLLNYHQAQKAIIFCNTKSMVDDLSGFLKGFDVKAGALHGDMPQSVRIQVLNEFKKSQLNVLVATDVAARGIDVDNVDLVVNFDIPQTIEYYTHRIGRTGRAGKNGVSLTLIAGKQQFFKLKDIIRHTKQDIAKQELPSANEMNDRIIYNKAQDIAGSLQKPLHPSAEKLVKQLKSLTHLNEDALLLVMANEWAHGLETYEDLGQPKNKKKDKFAKLTIPLGKKHKIRPKDLASALQRQYKLKTINNISIFKQYSTFEVPMKDMDQIKNTKKDFNFNNLNVQVKTFSDK